LLWPHAAELFEADAADAAAVAAGLGPAWSELREPWRAEIEAVFAEVALALPAESRFRSSGRLGVHSEHMGFILAEMQSLQRSFPGGRW
jgi:ring-1,2-phenylacetyl-CoA epoxidase subunit PaaC